ncbi:ATP-binding protein [Clostridium guangxiense]|uniref:ATP-binding protein n=1 Tax=Clostridium guangxiense TaxID=1662055 RepID=UPI001E4B5456|nr:ATP-binding protein [Clostridium guangxiense]MCD2345861.1 ATP-binding protein [Clostridium guangxiense]
MNDSSAVVGKFALDSLTIGMYENELVVYREYIQNSTDAIDKAVELGWISSLEESQIDIDIDKESRTIKIKDNGVGIPQKIASSTLKDIGNSEKDYSVSRGFRGIGRLAGTAYCNKMIFKTSTKGEDKSSIITWNCEKLKELLKPNSNSKLDLVQVIDACVSEEFIEEKNEKHYFEVKLEGVEYKNNLLDKYKVEEYLAQVAPIEIDSRRFYYYSDLNDGIKKFMKENGIPIEEYPIRLNGRRITKLYSTAIKDKNGKKVDDITLIRKKIIKDKSDNKLAFLWYGERKIAKGKIYDNNIAGIRYRKNNIMIGSSETLGKLFGDSETQMGFNKYYIGEIYILNKNIIPNARRDDFEDNDYYKALKEQIRPIVKELISVARNMSQINNAKKRIRDEEGRLDEIKANLYRKHLDQKEKEMLEKEVQEISYKIENDRDIQKNSSKKLDELGRKNVANNFQENENSRETKIKVKNINTILGDDDFKGKTINPLKGIDRKVQKTVRGILKILEKEIEPQKYNEIEQNIYKFVLKNKR